MSQETFDPITRSIRSIETEARLVIASAETAIASMRKNPNVTVAAYQEIFDKLGACLQSTNQIHDSVVAHAHLVADHIALRSRRNVLGIRTSLLETAESMIELCQPNTPDVYDPSVAFAAITDSLNKHGLFAGAPEVSRVALAPNVIGYVATYQLDHYSISIVVTVSCAEARELGKGSDQITVSVWEDRLPPIWDNSYHNAQGELLKVDGAQGKNLGRRTKQTDAALVDYVASVLSRDVAIPTTNLSSVPTSPRENTNRYGTQLGRPLRKGSDQFDYQQGVDILRNAITGISLGEQRELIIDLNPTVVAKTNLARYVLQVIQSQGLKDVEGNVLLSRNGNYQIRVFGKDNVSRVTIMLNGIMNG